MLKGNCPFHGECEHIYSQSGFMQSLICKMCAEDFYDGIQDMLKSDDVVVTPIIKETV